MTGISAANNLPKEKIKINIGTNILSIMYIAPNNQNLNSELLFLMPLLILHCRTRLFLVIVQQGSILGGARTLTLVHTVAGTVNDSHIVPHHTFQYLFKLISLIIKYVKFI